ncbi:MAG TPA: hypothetical protein VK468_09415 [Pyrinomonadaceae bacterium]|nr:hypothetical protein [Pyrinomonadaceae bacterium]
MTITKFTGVIFLIAAFIFISALHASAQRRDFMTEPEIELVRDNQDIDMRVDVLVKMIDRRFAALKIDVGGWQPPSKESDKWGEPPTGTRLELLTDIRLLLQKAIDDIDDVAAHDANAQTQNKTNGKLFPKAVRSLAAAATRYSLVLKPMPAAAANERERTVLLDSIEFCDEIIASVEKIPAEPKKTKT